jgi:endonuclease YncB( thermonuclease family)
MILSTLVAAWLCAVPPDVFIAKVVAVIDGDTVEVIRNRKKERIRLMYIDAPEKYQTFGLISRSALVDKIMGKEVEVRAFKRDRYARILAEIYVPGKTPSVNRQMVDEGYAWSYDAYSGGAEWEESQHKARQAKRGLWQSAETPIAPWLYRRGRYQGGPHGPSSSSN